jgi:hypothetical protein
MFHPNKREGLSNFFTQNFEGMKTFDLNAREEFKVTEEFADED